MDNFSGSEIAEIESLEKLFLNPDRSAKTVSHR